MGKPRLIIIIRHAQSEGNRDKTIHQHVPDHKVGLTDEGHEQARQAGEKLRALLREDDTLHFFISPYARTRQTTEGILSTLCSNEPAPSPFQRHHIKVYEEPRLREQDFGNFQPGTEETERLWRERAEYGHFFYRIPNGESGADVYDRVSSFNGSLWRRFAEDSMASVAVLVTHGLCSRIFLMAWYHYSVEFFEDLRNINHCEFLVMKHGKNSRYVLQNQLRRWSDLKRERAARRSISAASPPSLEPHIPVRRWGSDRKSQSSSPVEPRQPIRQNTADLFKDDDDRSDTALSRNQSMRSPLSQSSTWRPSSEVNRKGDSEETEHKKAQGLLSIRLQEMSISEEDVNPRKLGRDGGGTKSGAASPFDLSDDDVNNATTTPSLPRFPSVATSTSGFTPRSLASALSGELEGAERIMADALGDQSDAEVDRADLELGTKDRERVEMEQILADEVRDRIVREDGD